MASWSGGVTGEMVCALKILSFIHAPGLGGVERAVLRLAGAWHLTDHKSTVLVGRRQAATETAAGAMPRLNYDYPKRNAAWSAPVETLWLIVRLALAIRRGRPDVLFCGGNTYTVVAVAMKLLYGRKCPPIVAKISNDLARADLPLPFRFFYRIWVRIQGRVIDHFVAPAEPMRAQLAEALMIAPERISAIDNPVLDEGHSRLLRHMGRNRTPPRQGRRFIAVGRLARQKNFDLLLRGFAGGADASDTLALLGDGPERSRLLSLAEDLGISGRLTMPGHIEDTAAWLGRSDILILSSDYEGLPAVVVEALSAGLAVIATECSPNMPMLLGHGAFGQLVPPRDANGLAKAIADARIPPANRDDAQRHASRFTVAQAAPAFLELMQQLILRKRQSAGKNFGATYQGVRDCNATVVLSPESNLRLPM